MPGLWFKGKNEQQKVRDTMTDRRGSEEMWLMFLLFCQVMVYNGVAAALYLTAFLANAASVNPFRYTYFYNHLAAAAVSNWHHLHSLKYKACMLKYARNTVRSPSDNVSTNTNSCERFGLESLPFICSFNHPNAPVRPSARPPSLCHHCLVRCVPDSMLTYKAVAGTHTRHLQSWRTRLSLRLPWLGGVSYDWKDSKHLMKMYLCTTAASRSSPLLFKVNVQSKRKKEKKKTERTWGGCRAADGKITCGIAAI